MHLCHSAQNCHPERRARFLISPRFSGRRAAESRDLSCIDFVDRGFSRDIYVGLSKGL
jgi:hypothetical protein